MAEAERVEGPTPAGGAYSILYYMDDRGDRSDKKDAVLVEIVEYDESGNVIYRTYANA